METTTQNTAAICAWSCVQTVLWNFCHRQSRQSNCEAEVGSSAIACCLSRHVAGLGGQLELAILLPERRSMFSLFLLLTLQATFMRFIKYTARNMIDAFLFVVCFLFVCLCGSLLLVDHICFHAKKNNGRMDITQLKMVGNSYVEFFRSTLSSGKKYSVWFMFFWQIPLGYFRLSEIGAKLGIWHFWQDSLKVESVRGAFIHHPAWHKVYVCEDFEGKIWGLDLALRKRLSATEVRPGIERENYVRQRNQRTCFPGRSQVMSCSSKLTSEKQCRRDQVDLPVSCDCRPVEVQGMQKATPETSLTQLRTWKISAFHQLICFQNGRKWKIVAMLLFWLTSQVRVTLAKIQNLNQKHAQSFSQQSLDFSTGTNS